MNDFTVHLPPDERSQLLKLISTGSAPARKLLYARILLKADRDAGGPALSDRAIAEALETSKNTVARIRHRYVERGLEVALRRLPTRRVYQRKLDGAAEAHLVALSSSPPPQGQQRWTLHLLADRLVALHVVDSISDQTVRRTLKKTPSNRG
jgi:transposase